MQDKRPGFGAFLCLLNVGRAWPDAFMGRLYRLDSFLRQHDRGLGRELVFIAPTGLRHTPQPALYGRPGAGTGRALVGLHAGKYFWFRVEYFTWIHARPHTRLHGIFRL